MRALALALAATLSLSACVNVAPPASPGSVAAQTVVDERLARSAELAYFAARTAAELAFDLGKLKGENAAKAQVLNRRIYALLKVVRAGYSTANATSWAKAYEEATSLTSQLLALATKG